MAWKGSSNIDNGFVFDLRGLDKINISLSEQSVELGPGSPWTNVYAAMSQYNVTVTGARINAVGVGGFLTGGRSSLPSYARKAPAINISDISSQKVAIHSGHKP